MAADMHEFVDQQNIGTTSVLGHSMGGKVAMQLAVTDPERVEKLIVVDIAPKAYPAKHQSDLLALRDLDLGTFASFGQIDAALAPRIPAHGVRQFLLKNIERRADGTFHWRIDLDAMITNYHELTQPIAPSGVFLKPACFIRGGRSDYIRDEDVPFIERTFPRAKIVTIPNAGHWVHTDETEQFLKVVMDFLTSRLETD